MVQWFRLDSYILWTHLETQCHAMAVALQFQVIKVPLSRANVFIFKFSGTNFGIRLRWPYSCPDNTGRKHCSQKGKKYLVGLKISKHRLKSQVSSTKLAIMGTHAVITNNITVSGTENVLVPVFYPPARCNYGLTSPGERRLADYSLMTEIKVL